MGIPSQMPSCVDPQKCMTPTANTGSPRPDRSGYLTRLQARAWHWLVALNRAINCQFPDGIEGQGVNLMTDNGCQPTSLALMRACAALGIRQAFTRYSNPKGNADTERFLRTLKEELVWLRDWTSPGAFFTAPDRWPATTMPAISIQRSATERPRPSKPSISATPLP
jgi:transposase InsO family protein